MKYTLLFLLFSLFVGSTQCMNHLKRKLSVIQGKSQTPPNKVPRKLFQKPISEEELQDECNRLSAEYNPDNSSLEDQIKKIDPHFDEQESIIKGLYQQALDLDDYNIEEKEEFARRVIDFAKQHAHNRLGYQARILQKKIINKFRTKKILSSGKRSIALDNRPFMH